MSLIDAVLALALKRLGIHEQDGENCGPEVEKYLASVGLPKGNPWCAAYVHDTGATAIGALWPLPATGSCWELGDFAVNHHCRYLQPERGDVGLIWHPSLGRFGHALFVTDVDGTGHYKTNEGNSNEDGSRSGYEVVALTRAVHPNDRFVRWTELV